MLAISLGDPFSINGEILKLALMRRTPPPGGCVFFGSFKFAGPYLESCPPPWNQLKILSLDDFRRRHEAGSLAKDEINFVECGEADALPSDARLLTPQQRGGLAAAALAAVPKECGAAKLAVITLPIDKADCRKAGFAFPGQTEFFADLWAGQAVMLLAGPKLRVALATNHLALREVAAQLSQEVIVKKLATLVGGLRDVFGMARPRIAVCGLNPHCSDSGLFGDEEARIIEPAIARARSELGGAVDIRGPFPADTVFYKAYRGEFDAVLAMYHDQGLGPLKALHFDEAVNVSLGLRHLRMSPDHGPARDLYGKNMASPKSLDGCFDLAERYLLS